MNTGLIADLSIGRCIADLEALAKAAQPEDAQRQIILLQAVFRIQNDPVFGGCHALWCASNCA